MTHRMASVFLVLLTLGFLVFYHWQISKTLPNFMSTVVYEHQEKNYIVEDEFLILMEEGKEHLLNDVLHEYNLALLSPLTEWVQVGVIDGSFSPNIVELSSTKAKFDQQLLQAIIAHPAVHSAYLNYIQSDDFFMAGCNQESQIITDDLVKAQTGGGPKDPLYAHQWYLSKATGMDLPGAWAITRGSSKNVLALVDRNFQFTEEDLVPERCKSRQYYYENILDYFPNKKATTIENKNLHGTDVLSVVAPCTDNSLGLAGIDWHAQVFAVDSKADGSLATRMFGLMWAAGLDACKSGIVACPKDSKVQKNMHPANIINASFGFAGPSLKDPPYAPVLDVIGHINRQGRMLIASTGNERSLADRRLPGSAGGVISVGASNISKQSAKFSNFGRSVDVLAPGENILGIRNGQPVKLNGTSFSAPLVSGVASLMLAANPNLSWKHVEYILKNTSTPIACHDYCPATMTKRSRSNCQNYCCAGEKNICAAGIVNAQKAVETAKAGFPKTILVDVDDYFIPLSEATNYQAKVLVKNWGAKKGLVQMKKTNDYLKIVPSDFTIDAIDKSGNPATKEITILYDKIPEGEIVMSLILEAANLDDSNNYQDRIEAIVQIVPDIKKNRKSYNELLPRS